MSFVSVGNTHRDGLRLVVADSESRVAHVRELLDEYADSLGVDLSFQDFEAERQGLPGEYAPPDGRLLLALVDDRAAGCVAIRRLDTTICEMKRLYVRPSSRGAAVGRRLAERAIDDARRIGYRRMRLDTLPSMQAAMALYERLGFEDIPPYRFNPIVGSRFLELALDAGRQSG
jgi:ribosomal protein S18 acetylase RimI-like enzyme